MTARRALWIAIGAGTLVRLVLAFVTVGEPFDMQSYEVVSTAAVNAPLDIYGLQRWPYPPTYLLWAVPANELSGVIGIPLHSLIHLPAIAADAAIAWLVHRFLLDRGAPERRALAGAALVALGPSFIAISGHHGQFDSVAALPALAALVLWANGPSDRRALQAGLLVGIAASLKTPLGLMALAMLPTADMRQGLRLLVAAAAVPLMTLIPFLIADPENVIRAMRYNGVMGIGGIGLLVQPELARDRTLAFTEATLQLDQLAPYITVTAVLAATAYVIRRRTQPVPAAAILWLVFYVFGINFAFQYLVWGLPVFLLAGGLVPVAAGQVVAGLAALSEYTLDGPRGEAGPYLAAMALLLAGAAAALVVKLRRV